MNPSILNYHVQRRMENIGRLWAGDAIQGSLAMGVGLPAAILNQC